jgi:hypothetical protein
MAEYAFDMQLVVDPFNPSNVVKDGQVTIYAGDDASNLVPLTLTDRDGQAVANPIFSNSYGFLAPFKTTVPQVKWVSGEFGGFFNSYVGLRDEAIAAADRAEAAVTAALEAGSNAATVAQAELASAAALVAASASAAAGTLTAAQASQAAAEAAAAVTSGGGSALDPLDADTLVISTKLDGTVVLDPTDSATLLITV